jgi:hypothetical protein
MKRTLATIGAPAAVVMLAACASPELCKTQMLRHAEACAPVGTPIAEVKACFTSRGISDPSHFPFRSEYVFYQQCGLYWRSPFLASWAIITIRTESERVVSWQCSMQQDGP